MADETRFAGAFAPPSSSWNLDIRDRSDLSKQSRLPAVAVLIPCFNEELTVATVVSDFKVSVPGARIYVFDNNSKDATVAKALEAGAVVRTEQRQGKGHVVRRMFADIEADIYILVDGDDTYDASAAPALVSLMLNDGLDFVNVARVSTAKAYRRGHELGNKVLTQIVQTLFGRETSDMLSGYKGLSRRFVKSFPADSSGFETETELTVHALELRIPLGEITAPYKERPEGSQSKLRTVRDGFRVLWLIGRLVKDERPLPFFGSVGFFAFLIGIAIGVPIVATYFETGLVPRLPSAVLSIGFIILGWLSIFAGLILDVVAKGRREQKRLTYLAFSRF